MRAFVIMRSVGEYSDRIETPILVVSLEEDATRIVDQLDEAMRVLMLEKKAFHRDKVDPLRKILTEAYPPYDNVGKKINRGFWDKWLADPRGQEYKALTVEAEKRFGGLYDTPSYSYEECDYLAPYEPLQGDLSKYLNGRN